MQNAFKKVVLGYLSLYFHFFILVVTVSALYCLGDMSFLSARGYVYHSLCELSEQFPQKFFGHPLTRKVLCVVGRRLEREAERTRRRDLT